ncbi:MAG: hypothetical protein ACR2GJ_03180 [Gemmatimonadaceae bacterium]|jgi:hypothetical protein
MGAKLKQLLADYGPVAATIYFTLFFGILIGFYFAISAGWAPKGVAGNVGAWTAAYVATKLTQPLRIGATVLLTPIVSRLWQRKSDKSGPASPAAE